LARLSHTNNSGVTRRINKARRVNILVPTLQSIPSKSGENGIVSIIRRTGQSRISITRISIPICTSLTRIISISSLISIRTSRISIIRRASSLAAQGETSI